MEQLEEWELADEAGVLGENLPQPYFIHRKSHITGSGTESGDRRGRKLGNNRLICGTTFITT
jgi:hypothetical protein